MPPGAHPVHGVGVGRNVGSDRLQSLPESYRPVPGCQWGCGKRGASPWLAVGDGAVRFRAQLESAAVSVPADGSSLHRVSALEVCRLAVTAPAVAPQALVPEYVRVPDADLAANRPRR